MSEPVEVKLHLGGMAELRKDLADFLPTEMIEHFQKDNNTISRLFIRGFLSDKEHENACKRLSKKIFQTIGKKIK